ncbi:MAG: ABC transporter substrate-binding protein [Candidatus Cyclobacteriaceae bacterium M3_2C_046]
MKPNQVIFIVIFLFFFACESGQKQQVNQEKTTHTDLDAMPLSILEAKGFRVEYFDHYKLVTVKNPWKNAQKSFTYLLVQRGNPVPELEGIDQVVQIPVEQVVCFSTTHIPHLDLLNESASLIGFPTTDYISSAKVRKLIDQGKVTDLGSDQDVNIELLMALDPQMVMAFGMANGNEKFKKVSQAGIPVIYNADYMENSPLGRAEWLKFTSLFFNKETIADSVYTVIRQNYDSLRTLSHTISVKPKVFSGIVYGDTWFMPGGKNYAARFFDDAQAQYLWQENPESSYIELSFEVVYDKAHQAAYWIGVGKYDSLDELAKADSRYTSFRAFQNRQVYNYTARIGPEGGNEYFELGYVRPDLVLADLIKIMHPGLLPDYELYFHKKLTY